jgi:lysophospholipase L1-like esterase
MKNVLCYGDSNTWGYSPVYADRYGFDVRWAGVLRQQLGSDYWVIEEGLNGRTTVWDDPYEPYRNGKTHLMPILLSHKPLDLVVLMLGTNDLKRRFSLSAYDIARGVGVLAEVILRSECGRDDGAPQVLIMCPPPVAKLTDFADMFVGAEATSRQLAPYYQQEAEELGCAFLDAGQVIVSSDRDGIHFDPDEHRKLGEAVAEKVKALLG